MGYLSCNTESAISICVSYNLDFPKKSRKSKPFKITEFSYSDLHSSTNGFSQSNLLGKGSHGSVYKAKLQDGKLTAAVKKTSSAASEAATSNYHNNCTHNPAENEIEILSRVRNPNLVNLIGFAVDSNERRLIVVEFMKNGSLYNLLHIETEPPGWARRIRFALQVAKAVQFLHLSNPSVIHRDIKSSNVLIDAKWNARLGDFGLALRGHVEDVRARCTPPAGTLGYLDPGYIEPADLSSKSDVFSFGILLLEIISGRNAIDFNYSPPLVVDWAVPAIISGDYASICDPRIGLPEDSAALGQLEVVAARCVRSRIDKRPTISEVVKCLKVVERRIRSSISNNFGRRVTIPVRGVRYEPLNDFTDAGEISRVGSRRHHRKVSGATSVELRTNAIGGFSGSRSIGCDCESERSPLDLNNRKVGLALEMTALILKKSRSMGVLQSTRSVNNNAVSNLVRNHSVGELEESKLLIDIAKDTFKRDE